MYFEHPENAEHSKCLYQPGNPDRPEHPECPKHTKYSNHPGMPNHRALSEYPEYLKPPSLTHL